jgi:hypothetical protein
LVALCGPSGTRQISAAVAAHVKTDLRVGGLVDIEPNAIKAVGIPPSWDGPIPVSRENAALLANQATKARIITVPRLVAPNPIDAFPQGAHWVLELDRQVTLRRPNGEGVVTNALLVGTDASETTAMERGAAGLFLPRSNAPRTVEIIDLETRAVLLLTLREVGHSAIERVAVQVGGN